MIKVSAEDRGAFGRKPQEHLCKALTIMVRGSTKQLRYRKRHIKDGTDYMKELFIGWFGTTAPIHDVPL